MYAHEDSTSETICLEVTISKKKCCVTFAYRPPCNSNKDGFSKWLNKSLSNIRRKYENALVVGDLNIDILNKRIFKKLLISNLTPGIACVKSSVGSSIYVMLTNRPRNFQRTSLIETGMSDCHKLILSLFRAFFKRITTKTIQYLNCSNFSLEAFSTNWTKNSTKVSCTIVKINSMICFQIFSEQFLIIMLP